MQNGSVVKRLPASNGGCGSARKNLTEPMSRFKPLLKPSTLRRYNYELGVRSAAHKRREVIASRMDEASPKELSLFLANYYGEDLSPNAVRCVIRRLRRGKLKPGHQYTLWRDHWFRLTPIQARKRMRMVHRRREKSVEVGMTELPFPENRKLKAA